MMQTPTFDYHQIEPLIRQTLYDGIGPHIAIGTEEVDNGRVFLKVVATEFNGLSAKQKQEMVWKALNRLGATAQAIEMAMAFGTDEI